MTDNDMPFDATGRFKPQEVAFRDPGKPWKRLVCRNDRQLQIVLDRCRDRGSEVITRDAEVSR